MANTNYTMFNAKENTLYINSNLILPDTKGMNFRQHSQAYHEAFKLSYPERVKRFCPVNIKPLVEQEIKKHKGCKLSEFIDI